MIYCGLDLNNMCDNNGYVMALFRTGVEFGIWNGSFPWTEKYMESDLLELHIFNSEYEFRAVRSVRGENGFISNIIRSEDMKEKCMIPNDMLLTGEEWAGNGEGFYKVKESGREKKIYIPEVSKEDFEKGIFLKVEDYYDFDENSLMYLSGYRMTGIKTAEKGRRDQ